MLSPRLYDLLVHTFKDVLIAHENEKMIFRYTRDAISGYPKMFILYHGETYRCCCPFCGDTRHRLYLNHKWNQYDPVIGSRNRYLVKCFNEDCCSEADARDELARMVFRGEEITAPSYEPPAYVDVPAVVPGHIQPLNALAPDHHARIFLESKGFDPDYLTQNFGVGYCSFVREVQYSKAFNRIYIPISMEGHLKGWQARYIGDPNWKETGISKYVSMTRMKTGQLLYNFDQARKNPNILVLVEGPADVWRIRESAVALLGKEVSLPKAELIKANWPDATIILLLDSDAREAAKKAKFKLESVLSRPIITLHLPDDKDDPGSCSPEWLWEFICHEASMELGHGLL